MKISPNLGPRHRFLYVVLGVAMIAAPFMFSALAEHGWIQIVLPILGALSILTGATGW
ncbi:MAG: hypothetical protein R3284_08255 [Rubricoccaceae bacterium]|nr:hypothetical protein [Rubricoccaceae bacterium]